MIVCVTAEGNDLNFNVDQRFGRCKNFIIYNTENKQFESFPNPNIDGMGGVGIQSAQFVASKKAQVIITGKVGPNASEALTAAGIQVVLDVSGTIEHALAQFENGELKSSAGPNAGEKSGLQ